MSCIIRSGEVAETTQWFANQLRRMSRFDPIRDAIEDELGRWTELNDATVGRRSPNELKALYLCGPEPLNDLDVLLDCGINPHNVWALTSSNEDYNAALGAIRVAQVPLKVHLGGLTEFFDQFNESFDIIYFDACGAFCSGKPNTLDPIVTIFQRERLRSPGVLLTTFCQPPNERCVAQTTHLERVTAYFSSRYRDLPQGRG